MLIQFSVENYLSIKDKIVLSMLASRDTEHPEYLIVDGNKNHLKSTVIYGANASGKSNVLNAFWFMVNYVLTSHNQQVHKAIERSPFKFDRETPTRPSSFEVIFTANGIRYVYGFSVTDKAVVEEYLYYYPNGRQALIFERKDTTDFRFTVDVEEQNTLKERTSANKLYLSVASNWSYSKVVPVLEWFASCQIITKHSVADAYGLEAEQLKDDDYRRVIASMLRIADFGIQSLQVRDSDPIPSLRGDAFPNIEAVHTVQDTDGNASSYTLNMTEESDGTNSYFKLIGVVKKALDQGTLLVADEMDAHLHPLLTKHLVSLFNSTEFNPNGAQLIFTSHNTNLLDLDVLRRDQIWFTEKDEQTAATDLFSLYDFSIRKDAKVEKGYLIGRYGAIPFIKGGL
ncbi:AAA family ATPase [Anaeromassilibacillus sp. An200]|uniref:AAA family ATPase n=1 Tax=Anaeromassilibacillus sp. An200 TaxID=1965587 RepID=UPI000B3A51BB|nr:ATP-binding protein [Anaeromassilibacillus sp. An200]OUP05741.1 abortive phage infection protein [Anaeromassilibacillus sp. An200]